MAKLVTSKILATIDLNLDEICLIAAALRHASVSAGIEMYRNAKIADLMEDFETIKQEITE